MKVNYVLMYGIPYVRYKEFETFEDISKFLVNKGFVNYSIFKKLEDKEEIEMIYRDNDIRYLENFVKEQDKEIERLKRIIKIKDGWLSLIRDIGFDYDGYNKAEDLKKLTDELVEYSKRAIKNDDTSVAYVSTENGKREENNILMEVIKSEYK